MLVFSADGKPVADLKVGTAKPEAAGWHLAGQQAWRPAAWSGCGSATGTASRHAKSEQRQVAHTSG